MQIQIGIVDKVVIDFINNMHSLNSINWEDIWGSFSVYDDGKELFKDDYFLLFEFYNAIKYWENHKEEDFIYDAIDTPETNPQIAFNKKNEVFELSIFAKKTGVCVSSTELEQLCLEYQKKLSDSLYNINKKLTDSKVFSLLKQLETPYRLLYR